MHPGWADTGGLRSSLPRFRRLMRPLLRDATQGADTIVWLATVPSLEPAQRRLLARPRPASRAPCPLDTRDGGRARAPLGLLRAAREARQPSAGRGESVPLTSTANQEGERNGPIHGNSHLPSPRGGGLELPRRPPLDRRVGSRASRTSGSPPGSPGRSAPATSSRSASSAAASASPTSPWRSEPPTRVVFAAETESVSVRDEARIRPIADGGSSVVWDAELRLKGARRLLRPAAPTGLQPARRSGRTGPRRAPQRARRCRGRSRGLRA